MQSFDELVRIVEETKADIEKSDRGNKAAGTRVRGAMQQVKKAAQEVRKEVLARRGGAEEPAAGGMGLGTP